MVKNPSNKVKSESIDEVIIRLLGLKSGVEIDYQTYFDIIKKKLAIARLVGKEIPREEDELLREEFKRVRKLKESGLRFKVKKAKVKVKTKRTQPSPNQKQLAPSGGIVQYKKQGISFRDIIPTKVEDVTEKKERKKEDNISPIKKTLDSILKTLGSKFKFDKKQSDVERKEKETEKRGKRENTLEGFKKGMQVIASATKKLLSPFQNVIDRIWRFIFFTLLGKAFTKFMDWMGDRENQKKFNSLIEFLSDHWPALAGLYILFGTGFGKLVRGLLKGAARMVVALAMNAGKIRKFIGKHKNLARLGLAVAPLATRELGNIFGENKETPESNLIPKTNPDLDSAKKDVEKSKTAPTPKVNQYNDGGLVTGPNITLNQYNIGGLVSNPNVTNQSNQSGKNIKSILKQYNIGGLISKFSAGGMDFSSGVPITGAGKDDTLIAAKTGEAILTEKDQQDINQNYVDKNTGTPLNIPQYLSGRKPGKVPLSNIKPKFGGGFSLGGVIQRFNTGGIVGMQGGSLVPQGPFTPLPSPGYVRPEGSFIPKPMFRLPGPMPGSNVPFGYDPFKALKEGGVVGMQQGGMIGPSWMPWNWGKVVGKHRSTKPEDYSNTSGLGANLARRREMLKELGYQRGGVIGRPISSEQNQMPLTPEQMAEVAHGTTVRIMSTGAAPGSGVLVRNNKGLYSVLTAGHVIGQLNEGGENEIQIATPDGQTHKIIPNKSNLKDLRSGGVDLGMLQFESKNNYSVARSGTSQTDKVFVGGFPNIPMPDYMTNMTMRLQEGQLNSPSLIHKDARKKGYDIGYDAPTIGGMSGGPLLNAYGELIGIHGSGQTDDERTIDIKERGAAAIGYQKYLKDLGLEDIGTNTAQNIPKANFSMNLLNPERLRSEDTALGQDLGYPSLINYKGLSRKFFDQHSQWELPNKKQAGGVIGMQQGGMVRAPKITKPRGPQISQQDLSVLLAITSLESDRSQGRADVAQSLYNRLFSAQKYGTNYQQSGNSLRDLILASGQYQPTFSNLLDWKNIKDLKSASIAVMNSKKGKDHKWTMEQAMQQILATQSAIKNPLLQKNAQGHVQGRTYFLGTSQHENMKPGDVLRDKNSNFFSFWHEEGTPYHRERGRTPSPIPEMLLPKPPSGTSKPKTRSNKPNIFSNITSKLRSFLPFKDGGQIPHLKLGTIGKVEENEGINIPGATSDRQLFPMARGGAVALQPGEFVVTKKASQVYGYENLQKINSLDENSKDAKITKKPVSLPQITPYKTLNGSSISGTMTLPPIDLSSGKGSARSSGYGGGSSVPSFPTISPINDRDKNAKLYYGIV